MRTVSVLFFLLIFYSCANSSGEDLKADKAAYAPANSSKILIELFTSQGCSSCPSADKLMGDLLQADTNIITLSFHVDYWDRLGWKDIFSNHEYTVRQQEYVSALHAESLYTPEAVVGSEYEMVGSNRTQINTAIAKIKSQSSEANNQTINAAADVVKNIITVHYRLSQPEATQQVIAVLAQNKATTAVAHGENAGAQLTDFNVARSIQYLPAQADGMLQISVPEDLKTTDASVIIFVQNAQTKHVSAVAQVKL